MLLSKFHRADSLKAEQKRMISYAFADAEDDDLAEALEANYTSPIDDVDELAAFLGALGAAHAQAPHLVGPAQAALPPDLQAAAGALLAKAQARQAGGS